MYDDWTRQVLARALADAFTAGRWRAEDLAERGAGILDRRPEWIDALAFAAAASARTAPVSDRAELEELIERWLADRPDGPDVPAPVPLAGTPERPRPRRPRSGGPARPGTRRREPYVPAVRGPIVERGWPLARITSVEALADLLELSGGQLAWLADVRGLERTVADERLRNYRYRWIPRRSGGLPRLIEAPKLRLKEVQRWVLREILAGVPAHDAAHGFTRGRSARTHAALHVGRPGVLCLDLRDFFTSVTAGRVFGIFRTIGYAPEVAHVLCAICTNVIPVSVWNVVGAPRATAELASPRFHLGRALATPHLPQGAPTSPAIANLAAHGLDRRLSGLATACELTYSRYADDLAFSGPGLTGRRAAALAAQAGAIAREEGFALQPRKSRLRTAARRQLVTGVVVNAHLNVPRDEYDRLRATLHQLALDGPGGMSGMSGTGDAARLRAHLHGRIAWVESLNPGRGAKLRRQFEAIDWGRADGNQD